MPPTPRKGKGKGAATATAHDLEKLILKTEPDVMERPRQRRNEGKLDLVDAQGNSKLSFVFSSSFCSLISFCVGLFYRFSFPLQLSGI